MPDFSELKIWRKYRGCYQSEKSFRACRGTHMTREEFDAKVQPLAEELSVVLRTVDAAEDKPEAIRELPLRGREKALFGGKKCTGFCDVRDVCFGLAGEIVF